MINWADYKQKAKARGALACELYVAISTPVATFDTLEAVLPEHLAYQQALEKSGKLAFAGPLSDETGANMPGIGLIVYRAGSFEEANQLANDDPMHKQGVRQFTLQRWLINEGSLQLNLGLSSRSVMMT